MAPSQQVRLATLPGGFARDARRAQAAEWLDIALPDGVIPLGDVGGVTRAFLARYASDSPPVLDPKARSNGPEERGIGDETVLVAGSRRSLGTAIESINGLPKQDARAIPPIIVTDALSLSIDTTALSTTIEGQDLLADTDTADQRDGDKRSRSKNRLPLVISTGIPAGYRNTVSGFTLLGAGEPDNPDDHGSRVLEIRPERILDHPIDTGRLGLEAIRGVGPRRASTLASAGLDTREQVAAGPLSKLRDLDGIGPETARSIQDRATAIAEGRVLRRSRDPLPAADPVFIDIETDGLHPTVTWLIGVLDGGSATGTYHSFLDRDPEDPGAALEGFIEWYLQAGEGRTLVAYNGEGFDFRVLREHLQAYRPDLAPVFERADRFDPYTWAVEEGNAFLPGRTNRLADVATALGHDSGSTGVTGAAVARAYRRWATDPRPETEPAWEDFDAYCEDDVRALARVYEALELEDAVEATSRGTTTAETTTQGTLSEW